MRILIADDSPTALNQLRETLVKLGHETVEARDGLEALERLTGPEAPAMAILDWLMPGLDGPDVCARLRGMESARQPYLMLLTMKDTQEDLIEGLGKGANDFVSKPYHEGELIARIQVGERTLELERANGTLRMISECNQAIAHIQNERELAQRICRVIRRLGGYRMTWVGYAESDEARTVRPVAWDGDEEGYLAQARITWADEPLGRGPTGSCIRLGEVCLNRDFRTDEGLAPWRARALGQGLRSSLALPLAWGGQVFGALSIYSDQPDGFDQDEVTHLTDLSNDLTLGILAIRTRSERDEAREVAEHRATRLRTLASELFQTEQRERQKLGKILHDHIQQLLAGAQFGLAGLAGRLQDAGAQSACGKVADMLKEAIQASRSLAAELSPPILHERGLSAAVTWLSRQMQERHGLTVEVAVDGHLEALAPQYSVFAFDAIRELLFNVVKHAGVDHARVLLTSAKNTLEVTIEDEGAGFEAGRVEVGGSDGAGLGLFSLRERLGYLGGWMLVESGPGRGSRIRLAIPLDAAPNLARGDRPEPGQASPPPRRRREDEQRKVRILLADDHPVVRQSLALLLENQPGFEVVAQAGDGEEAVELAHKLLPDVVVMDISMPRMDGIEATRLLSRDLPDIAVIGLSMHEDPAMAKAIRKVGALDFATKGGASEKLISAIRTVAQLTRDKIHGR